MLFIDKPKGWTSFDVVGKVRRVVAESLGKKSKQVKVGHCGTLDPLATGLLILLVGKYTKLAPKLSKLDKTYVFSIRLGVVSTTGDEEGTKKHCSSKRPTLREIDHMLAQFRGEIRQVPPSYSAIKINGQRAYKLARAGQPVDIKPRTINILDLRRTKYRYPELELVAEVSSGTYIRSLAEDMGKFLGCGGYVSRLRRVKIDRYNVDNAISPETLTSEYIYDNLRSF